MSALTRLWKRAFLWRICVIVGLGSTVMTIFFPTLTLKKYAPWLPGKASSLAQLHPDQSAEKNTQKHTAEHINFPDIERIVTRHILLAGHKLPLPEGEWHPVLIGETTDETPFSFISLIRTDHGAVTGFITAQATQKPIAQEIAEPLLTPCHDDRNYGRHSEETQEMADCSFLSNAVLEQNTVSLNPFIAESFSRVRQLGFPLPPLMITAGWRRLDVTPTQQVQAIALDVLIAPLSRDTHQMLAPPTIWTKEHYKHSPDARNFINASLKWLPEWQTTLQLSITNSLASEITPLSALQDPASPQ